MNYYKLINGNDFVGIATQCDFRKFQQKHSILLGCDEEGAQYIQCNNLLYHDNWMLPLTTNTVPYEMVQVISIDEGEYTALFEATEKGENIEIPEVNDNEIIDEPDNDPIEEITIEYVRKMKLSEISSMCNKTITHGFDVVLSDDETYHFSLTTQDQLNLITLSAMVSNGENMIPYHADGKLCKFYSVEDINTIVSAATSFKTYHVSYHNALKAYVEAQDTIAKIEKISYGVKIPKKYQSEVLKAILQSSNEE